MRPSRWGSGLFQLARFDTANMPSPLGPAQVVESQSAVLQLSGSFNRVPDAVASTKIADPLVGGVAWTIPVSRLQSW